MRIQLPSIFIPLVAVGCQFQASCGGKKLDMEKARQFVTTTLEREAGQKPETTCPESVPIEKGKTFECTAKFGAAAATVVIEQDDDQGTVTIKSVSGILMSSKLEQLIAEQVGKQLNVHIEVACGERVRPAVPDATFQCDAKDAKGATAKVDVTVKDTAGNVRFDLVP